MLKVPFARIGRPNASDLATVRLLLAASLAALGPPTSVRGCAITTPPVHEQEAHSGRVLIGDLLVPAAVPAYRRNVAGHCGACSGGDFRSAKRSPTQPLPPEVRRRLGRKCAMRLQVLAGVRRRESTARASTHQYGLRALLHDTGPSMSEDKPAQVTRKATRVLLQTS